MPFLRFSRDKRGYEHTYLMHTVARRGRPARTRVLYWYRTPPGVRVGRAPFDEEVRRLIEGKNPGVVFDWEALASTPVPPPIEAEPWRERRRAERAAKQARRAEELEEEAPAPAESSLPNEGQTKSDLAAVEIAASDATGDDPGTPSVTSEQPPQAAAGGDAPAARRRRRRGGRGRRERGSHPAEPSTQGEVSPVSGTPPAESSDPTSETE